MSNSKVKRKITIRLDEETDSIFQENFKKSGLNSKNSYFKFLIKYGLVYKIDFSYLQEFNMQIGAIGNNINQIAKHANSNNYISQEDINTIKEYMKELWQLQQSIRSLSPSVNP